MSDRISYCPVELIKYLLHFAGEDEVPSMMVSLKVYDEGDDFGRIEIYDRRSPSSRVLIGAFKFQEENEKNALLDMLVTSHPEVDVIPNEMTSFGPGDAFFK